MNKIFALEETVRIWKKLAETGSEFKSSVSGASEYKKYCPCCHYVLVRLRQLEGMWGDQCQICPAKSVWGYSSEDDIFCSRKTSPYLKWMGAYGDEERKHFAKLLYSGVEEVLSMEYLKEMNQ